MIKINGIDYKKYRLSVSLAKFSSSYFKDGVNKKLSGRAPYIVFDLLDDRFIIIETTYSEKRLRELEYNIERDITDSLTMISIQNKNAAPDFLSNNFEYLNLKRIDKNKFILCLKLNKSEENPYEIVIYEEISIENI